MANAISPSPLTKRVFTQHSRIPFSRLRYHFGTFNRAVQEAGLSPNQQGIPASGYQRLSKEDLLNEIERLWKATGDRPSESVMNSDGEFSARPYITRWGSFSGAVEHFIKARGIPENVLPTSSGSESTQSHPRSVVIPKTHKPKKGTSEGRRILYGEPLDFRGLRYSPVNEQGVVYLFGMVSRELGFLIESIRTDFPDCEGKRCLDTQSRTWEHVRIEFEYKSSSFSEHGHDPEGCDLIVCWIHDWSDCPIEVLELRTEIKKLPERE